MWVGKWQDQNSFCGRHLSIAPQCGTLILRRIFIEYKLLLGSSRAKEATLKIIQTFLVGVKEGRMARLHGVSWLLRWLGILVNCLTFHVDADILNFAKLEQFSPGSSVRECGLNIEERLHQGGCYLCVDKITPVHRITTHARAESSLLNGHLL